MSEVKRFIRIRGRELHHDVLAGLRKCSEIAASCDFSKQFIPIKRREQDVQESLHTVISCYFRDIGLQPLSYRISGILRGGVGDAQKRECNEGIISLKFFSGNLDLECRWLHISPVYIFNSLSGFSLYK